MAVGRREPKCVESRELTCQSRGILIHLLTKWPFHESLHVAIRKIKDHEVP